MATTTTATSDNNEISRQEIEAAIAKAVELRALHASLMQGNSPVNLKFPTASPSLHHHVSQFSAQDYPVFTPSYEDEPLPGSQQIQLENQFFSENFDEYGLRGGNESSRKGFLYEDQRSVTGSCITVLRASPKIDLPKPRRHSLGDFKSDNIVVPLTDSHSSVQSQSRNRGLNFSWIFPRLKKKHKNRNSPNRAESEESSIMSIETLKKELMEANKSREAALMEAAEMKSSFGELKQKLQYLETYCEELKKALIQTKDFQVQEKLYPRIGKSMDGNGDNLMPVSEEVMVEGFLQIVSEARLSVKQFCKTLVGQIEETDNTLRDNLTLLLQPYKLSLNFKYSKSVLFHLESIINQSLYEDFENCGFQKNGSPKFLNPKEYRESQFSSYVSLRNLSWNEVLRKGTKYYSEEFSKFCDQKMSCIMTTLNWTRPWPEQLLQAFFVASKCIWLLHLLAFSFSPVLGIFRVEENRRFDSDFMEDIFVDRQRSHGSSRVKIMVMPGFYVQDIVIKCMVLCRYKSVA